MATNNNISGILLRSLFSELPYIPKHMANNVISSIRPLKNVNEWPVRHIGLSAGYNMHDLHEADWRALEKYFSDFLAGRKNRTLQLTRSLVEYDGKTVDDLKFLYFIGNNKELNAPVSAFQATAAMLPELIPSLLGSPRGFADFTIEDVVEACNRTRSEGQPELRFVKERENIGKNAGAFVEGLGENVPVLWNAADTPFAINYFWALSDKDAKKYSVVIDLNVRSNIPQLWPRNYYSKIIGDEKVLHWKEPNRWIYTALGYREADRRGLIDLFFENRKGGKQEEPLLKLVDQVWKHPIDLLKFYKLVKYIKTKADDHVLTEEEAGAVLTDIINDSYIRAPIRVKARHNDPMVVRDVDGLHDLVYYIAVLERINVKLFPNYNQLVGVSEELREMGRWSKEYLNDKVNRLNEKLSHFSDMYYDTLIEMYNKNYSERYSLDEFMHKAKSLENIKIPLPFNNDGTANLTVLGDNLNEVEKMLKKTIDYMTKKKYGMFMGYFRKYEKDKNNYYR